MMKNVLFALTLCMFWVSQGWALPFSFSGSLTNTNGLSATASWNQFAEFSWLVDNTTNDNLWTYQYHWKTNNKELSHIIIEVSSNFKDNNIYSGTTSPNILGTFGQQGNSNPGIPGDIYGLKFDLSPASKDFSFTIVTDRAPMWGNVYAKDGKDGGADVYAYNIGFLQTPPTFDLAGMPMGPIFDGYAWVLVPDTFSNGNGTGQTDPIPEPSTILLLGAGLAGLGIWHRRRKV